MPVMLALSHAMPDDDPLDLWCGCFDGVLDRDADTAVAFGVAEGVFFPPL